MQTDANAMPSNIIMVPEETSPRYRSRSDVPNLLESPKPAEDLDVKEAKTMQQPHDCQAAMAVIEFPDHSKAYRVNPAHMNNPKYAYLLRDGLPRKEVFWKLQTRMPMWWCVCWSVIIGCWRGFYPKPVMVVLYMLGFARWGYALHDSSHVGTGLSEQVASLPRLSALFVPFMGFTPLQPTYRDIAWLHVHEHHHLVKSVMDHGSGDWDTKWSAMPLWKTIICLFAWPSHFSFGEVAWHWLHCPAAHWPERIGTNVLMWAQIYVAHKMNLLKTCLVAGHISGVALIVLFHGLTHRASYYQMLMKDPSGSRSVRWLDTIANALLAPGQWDDMKFHDAHHALCTPTRFGTMSLLCRFYDVDRVRTDIADMVDEGLFVDADGKVFNHLAQVGYKLGSRKKHLESSKKTV